MRAERAKTAQRAEPERKQVGIWIRVSTEDQARGDSPEHHEKRARYYAESKNWIVREVYRLDAVSGKAVLQHPEAKRMLADIKRGNIGGLIFSKLARLARNTKELLEASDFFQAHQADLISLDESIDTSTPAGRLFYTMIAAMAQWEREEIASRVAASVPIRAKLGKSTGGAAPFGYRWDNRKLVVEPAEAPVRKLIFDLFLEHRRKKTVARVLNEAGHRTRGGGKFSDTTIDRLLRDPVAKGLRRANYTKSLGEKKHWVHKPETDWIFTDVEAIVEPEIWEQANAILDDGRKKRRRMPRKAVNLFSGFAHCQCGRKMYVPSNTPKYVCYGCRNKIPVQDLEEVYHSQLEDFVFSPTEIALHLNSTDETIKQKEVLLRTLDTEQDRLTQDLDKLWDVYRSGEITKEAFGRRNRPLEERLAQIQDELPTLQGEIDFLKIQRLSSDQILTEARDLYARWLKLSDEEKRHIVEQITERITIGKDSVEIDLCSLPSISSPELMAKGQHISTGSSQQRA